MNKILCIYPDDHSTKFLDRIQNHLKIRFGDNFHCFKIKPNDLSHKTCLERLVNSIDERFILFLGHGGSDYLFGSTSRSVVLSESAGLYEDIVEDFSEERFISRHNVGVFKGKKVFCLSCDSSEELGNLAIQEGAKVFIGFGKIPSDINEVEEDRKKFPLHSIISKFKGEIVWIVKSSLVYSINQNYNFYQLADTIKLFSNHRINEIILQHKGLKSRRLLADYLFNFKDGMKVFGNGFESIIQK